MSRFAPPGWAVLQALGVLAVLVSVFALLVWPWALLTAGVIVTGVGTVLELSASPRRPRKPRTRKPGPLARRRARRKAAAVKRAAEPGLVEQYANERLLSPTGGA